MLALSIFTSFLFCIGSPLFSIILYFIWKLLTKNKYKLCAYGSPPIQVWSIILSVFIAYSIVMPIFFIERKKHFLMYLAFYIGVGLACLIIHVVYRHQFNCNIFIHMEVLSGFGIFYTILFLIAGILIKFCSLRKKYKKILASTYDRKEK
jgi:hypothetical protein